MVVLHVGAQAQGLQLLAEGVKTGAGQAAQAQLFVAVFDVAGHAAGRQAGQRFAAGGQQRLGIALGKTARGLAQVGHFACHLHRRIHHHLYLGEGRGEHVAYQCGLGLQLLALLPGPDIGAQQGDQQQGEHAPACRLPGWRVEHAVEAAAQPALQAVAATVGKFKLGQIPVAAGGVQHGLGQRVQAHGALQQLLGRADHGRFGVDDRVGPDFGQQWHRFARQRQHQHGTFLVCCAVDHGLRPFRAAGDKQLRTVRRCLARSMAGHNAADGAASTFEHLQMFLQPGARAAGHPEGFAAAGIGLQGKVQLCRIVQQALFEQAFEHGTQPG